MDENPYKVAVARQITAPERPSDGALLLRAVALTCWGVCLLLVWPLWRLIDVLSEVPPTFISPVLTWPLVLSGFPIWFVGFLLLGISAWLRLRSLAVCGACCFIPLPLYLAYVALTFEAS